MCWDTHELLYDSSIRVLSCSIIAYFLFDTIFRKVTPGDVTPATVYVWYIIYRICHTMANVELSTMTVLVVKRTGANMNRSLSLTCLLEPWDVCATAKGSRAFQQIAVSDAIRPQGQTAFTWLRLTVWNTD